MRWPVAALALCGLLLFVLQSSTTSTGETRLQLQRASRVGPGASDAVVLPPTGATLPATRLQQPFTVPRMVTTFLRLGMEPPTVALTPWWLLNDHTHPSTFYFCWQVLPSSSVTLLFSCCPCYSSFNFLSLLVPILCTAVSFWSCNIPSVTLKINWYVEVLAHRTDLESLRS